MIKRKIDFAGETKYFLNEETGHQYSRIVGGVAWPFGDRAGFLVAIAETLPPKPNHKPHFYVLGAHEDFNVSNLLNACIAFKSKFFIRQFYGDTNNEPFMDNYFKLKISFPLTSAPFIDDPNALNSYIAQIRECTATGKKRLHFSGSSLGTRLLEIPADKIRRATKAQDFPIVAALGGALSALITLKHDPDEQYKVDLLNEELSELFDD
jgi:hypothetical protein